MIFTSCIQVTSAVSLTKPYSPSLLTKHSHSSSLIGISFWTNTKRLSSLIKRMSYNCCDDDYYSVSSSLLVYISFVIKISFESRRNSTRQQGRVKAAYAYLFIYWLGRRRSHGRSEHLAWRVISSNSLILNTKRPCKVIFVTPTTGLTDNLTQSSVQRMETNS